MRGRAATAVLVVLALGAPSARGQEGATSPEELPLVPDSLFQAVESGPFIYSTNYDLNEVTGTWNQSASYGLRHKTFALDLGGSSATIDNFGGGIPARGSQFTGVINYRAARRWYFSINGMFQANSSGGGLSGDRQHQNRIGLRSQYSTGHWRGLWATATLYSEFQRDFSLSGGGRAVADTDTVLWSRDSTIVTGRKDGASAQLKWNPGAALSASFQGSGSRAKPDTRSITTKTRPYAGGTREFVTVAPYVATPITSTSLLANLGFKGIPKVTAGLQLKRTENVTEFFDASHSDPVFGNQEHYELHQRAGTLHLESQPSPRLALTADGTLSWTSSEFRFRPTTSLVRTQQMAIMAAYTRPETRGSIRLEITRARGERQISQNGVSITRLLTATAARRLTSRLSLDGTGSVYLSSRQLDYAAGAIPLENDRDDARNFFNVGGGYSISAPCSIAVHFSRNRSHAVNIGTRLSGLNTVETNYQMNAVLTLQASRNLSIRQRYLLGALYRVYDFYDSTSLRDYLSRSNQIDTSVSDTLLPYVYATVLHNFVHIDLGPYVPGVSGGRRLYDVTLERFQQNLSVTLGIRSPTGITGFVTQNLANTRERVPASASEKVENRWTLTFGGDITRTLANGTQLQVTAQHIGAYTERPQDRGGAGPPGTGTSFDPAEKNYWVINALVQKAF